MRKLNICCIFNKEETKVLMCLRSKDPYKGLYNFVGGKLENGETDVEGAYRELQEETAITKNDIILKRVMDFEYYVENVELQLFVGILNKEVKVKTEKHKLYWLDKKTNFFDKTKFAGYGNIGHMINYIDAHYDEIFKKVN